MTGNEKWRVATPILLVALTLMSGWATYILSDLRGKVKENCVLIRKHMINPDLHFSVVKDVEWLKRFIDNGGSK